MRLAVCDDTLGTNASSRQYARITPHGTYIADSNHEPSAAGLGVWGAFVLYKGRYIMASHERNMVDTASGPGGGK